MAFSFAVAALGDSCCIMSVQDGVT